MKTIEVRIANRKEDITLAVDAVDRFAAETRMPAPVLHDLRVVLDEVLSNIMAHGYETDVVGEIRIQLEHRPEDIVMVVEDDGRRFDPTEIRAPDLTSPLRLRKPGGLGIPFILALMDEVTYSRVGDTNRLCLSRKFGR